MILFRATSHHQLMNAIAIKFQYCPDEEADLIISNYTDFSGILDNIKASGVFRKVYYVDDLSVAKSFIALSKEERLNFSRKVGNLWDIELDVEYTDYYYGYHVLGNRLFYYYLVNKQGSVIPHSFQEGASSYLTDIWSIGKGDDLDHSYYKKNSLLDSLKDLYMYLPESLLFNSPIPVKTIDIGSDKVRDIIKKIYNPPPLPPQQIVYIAVSSEFQGISSNEVELVDSIAEIVGKENIVIKNHPKCKVDKFSYRGYKVIDSSVAFEAYLLDDTIRDKIMIAPLSTSLISASFLCKEYSVIIVKELINCDLSRFIDNDKMNSLLKSVAAQSVSEDGMPSIFYAKNTAHLTELINYLKGIKRLNG